MGISAIGIDLDRAVEAVQDFGGVFAFPAGAIIEHDTRGRDAAPAPVIPQDSPEIARLRGAAPRVQHRGGGFVHKQLTGSLQMLGQSVDDGLQVERGLANPVGQNGAV